MIFGTGVWSWWILGRNSTWLPPLRWTILGLTLVATIAAVVTVRSPGRRRFAAASLAVGLTAALAGAGAYTIATIGQPHTGGGPAVGPAATAQATGHGGAHGDQNPDNPRLDALLSATHTEWSAAITRSSSAASLELSTNTAVMAIGGFSGSDPVPTLSQFQDYVVNHRVTYYIAPKKGNDHGPGGGHPDIEQWVATNFTPVAVGSDTVYDLTTPKST
jgi:4-amino-4-deoxy-L-arabinose transferase-like glycosyltransferase